MSVIYSSSSDDISTFRSVLKSEALSHCFKARSRVIGTGLSRMIMSFIVR
jgi:hypothetical protein